jgi:hypothetical protein
MYFFLYCAGVLRNYQVNVKQKWNNIFIDYCGVFWRIFLAPVKRSIDQYINQSSQIKWNQIKSNYSDQTESFRQWMNQNEWMNQSINQSNTHSLTYSLTQPINQLFTHSINQSINNKTPKLMLFHFNPLETAWAGSGPRWRREAAARSGCTSRHCRCL